MAYIYAYAPDEGDCSTIGLVGALLDEDAVFDLKAGEFGELSFRHPFDPYGKWKALVNGAILKTMIPVRMCPGVKDDGGYVTSVDVYTVSTTATKNQRCVWSKKTDGRKKKLLKAGQEVTVTGVADPADGNSRYRVRLGKVSGWMDRGGLTLTRQDVAVNPSSGGMESVTPSYAVRQQLFRIAQVRPEDGERIGVRALRIAYDLLGNVSFYQTSANVSCLDACRGILESTIMPHDFNIYTDIGDSHTGFDAWDKNPVSALVEPESGVLDRWGAEIVADDSDLYVLRRAGLDRGVSIEYGKNLTGIDVDVDATGVVNAVRAKGEKKDGSPLYLDGHVVNGRHGYNYDSDQGTCADWLPEGYRFYVTPAGVVRGSTIVRASFSASDVPKIAVVNCTDARVEKKGSGVTAKVARRRLAEAAVSRFEAGCDLPEISMDVDFVMLGDTGEYAQYRHLEPLFVYDTVHVRDRRMGVRADIGLTAIKWLVRQERVSEASFGSLKNVTARIQGWQITGIDGGKIVPGSLGAEQLDEDIISARHVQAESISTGALQAESVTAEKIAAGAVDAMSISALTAHLNQITAQTIQTDAVTAALANVLSLAAEDIRAGRLSADRLSAVLAEIISVQAQVGSFDLSTVTNLVSSALTLRQGFADSMTIVNLAVTSANLLNATIGRLVVLGEDGRYYEIGVGADGVIHTSEYAPTQQELNEGVTSDGRAIVTAETVNAQTIAGQTIAAREGVIGAVLTSALTAGKITASEALLASASIPMLYAASIKSLGDTIDISANRSITLMAGQMDRMLRLDGEGLHVGDSQARAEVLIDSDSVNVRLKGENYSRFGSNYVQFGDYRLRRSVDGGLVFIKG